MSTLVVPQTSTTSSHVNRSILLSVVLSVVVTLILWGLQAIFHFSPFWLFLIYIGILLLLFYVILPRFS